MRPRARRADRGAATIWVLCGALLIMGLALVVLSRGEVVLARHRAESAADLGALAAAGGIGVDGSTGQLCARAQRVVHANGLHLDKCTVHVAADGRTGTVAVRVSKRVRVAIVGSVRVTSGARAGRLPG